MSAWFLLLNWVASKTSSESADHPQPCFPRLSHACPRLEHGPDQVRRLPAVDVLRGRALTGHGHNGQPDNPMPVLR